MTKTKLMMAAVAAMLFTGCTKDLVDENAGPSEMNTTNTARQNIQEGANSDHVPNEVLVKFKPGVGENGRSQALLRVSGRVQERILTASMKRAGDAEGVFLVKTPLSAYEAAGKLKGVEVVFAEPNFIYQHSATSNDPFYTNGNLWGMYGDATTPVNQYGSQAGEAWTRGNTGSSGVFIGIIDEGVMFTHTDLMANAWTNPHDPVDGRDNDGNGYIDDVNGWDFDANNNTVFDGIDDDHGTHVAGTIGAKGGNGIGVAGVTWNVTMIAAKFLGRRGGTTANAIKAIDYFTDLKTRHGLNIPATNNSWGGGGFSQALKDAIDRANTANILFVAAAGNDGADNDATTRYPSGYSSENIIAVASITNTGGISSFSNFGATSVDLGAPGSSINSTLPVKSGRTVASGYGSYSGTSMATPHVTGGIALYTATHAGATAAQIKSAVLSSTVPTASLTGKTVTSGRLNVSGF